MSRSLARPLAPLAAFCALFLCSSLTIIGCGHNNHSSHNQTHQATYKDGDGNLFDEKGRLLLPAAQNNENWCTKKGFAGRFPQDPTVGVFTSSPWSFCTSSYWIEGPTGVILIDTQFLLSDAAHFVEVAEQATGKKVVLAVVLHANPDKFNGTAILQQRGIRVVTSQQVRDLIPSVHEKRVQAFYDRYAPDYPKDEPQPDVFGDQFITVEAGGVSLHLYPTGAGCSEAHVLAQYKDHVFVGDLVANQSHTWLEIGKYQDWYQRLDDIRALQPLYVHPGRGPSGDVRLVNQEREYINFVVSSVRNAQNTQNDPQKNLVGQDIPNEIPNEIPAATLEQIKQTVEQKYPDARFSVFLQIGLPALWRAIKAENQQQTSRH